MRDTESSTPFEAVAIIGLAGRFPGARNVEEFWRNLRDGVESISVLGELELEADGVGPEIYGRPDYIRAKGLCDDVELFDAAFFGLTPKEAEIMDPQHRLFLECAWEALENAGYDFEEKGGRVGVYAGSSMSTYLLVNLLSNPGLFEQVNGLQARIMNDKDFLTTHVSYKLNLNGPSVAVQTACSTSLVAVHLAAQALLDGECDMALAGGVTLRFPYRAGYLYQPGGIWSRDGHCRAFDAEASGTVEGNGAGVVVLKRLSEAVADGDRIHAIIKGSAVNNDGARKAGYTAPSAESQARVVGEALTLAGVAPETISCVEAHGSGTPLGDAIEFESLVRAFRTGRTNYCALGSAKTNVGHLDNAAGITSLIKMVQALKHGLIPPSLHFKQPPPPLSLGHSPFYVNTKLTKWPAGDTPRRAGVSSLGIGGTNAHVILEEAAAPPAAGATRPWQLLLLSARSDAALTAMTANLAEHLKQNPDLNVADVAHTLQVGRRRFSHRRAVLCRDSADAVEVVTANDAQRVLTGGGGSAEPGVVFMFPGLGDHYPGMAAGLYESEATFRSHLDLCAELLMPHLNLDLRDVLYPRGVAAARGAGSGGDGAPRRADLRKLFAPAATDEAASKLNQTYLAQPAVFVVEYALAQLLLSWGIRPQAMIGYSIGEYVAACLAGVFPLETALALVAERARMIQELPGGAMLAIPLPDTEVRPLLDHRLSLAACDGPLLSVVGGTFEAVETLARELARRDITCLRLQSTHAFHSQMMEPITGRFAQRVGEEALRPPQIPFVSNLTGAWITAEEATDPHYWARHIRHTVLFAEGLGELLRESPRIMLEVGPGHALGTLVRQHPAAHAGHQVLAALRDGREEVSDEFFLMNTLGRLWLAGCRPDWRGFSAHERRRRVPLPSYPFERQRYWIEPGRAAGAGAPRDASAPQADFAEWFYLPVWKQSPEQEPPAEEQPAGGGGRLVFLDELGVGARVADELARRGEAVVRVEAAGSFVARSEDLYGINPQSLDDYNALVQALGERGMTPLRVAHLWSVTAGASATAAAREFDSGLQARGYQSLLFLAQAFGEQGVTAPVRIDVVSNQLHAVTGDEPLCPQKATLRGACKVIPQEYPNLTCRSIDVVADAPAAEAVVGQLVKDLSSSSADQTVAYRGRRRWVLAHEAARTDGWREARPRLKEGGGYLVTGGLEEAGLVVAEHLARAARARLALVAGPDFPPQDKWEKWLSAHDDDEPVSCRIRRVRALEAEGREVLFFTADLSSEEQVRGVVARACARFGRLDGVVHAAGHAGSGLIQLKTPETISAALTPKVKGTLALAAATDELALDFFVLFSSITSVAGGFGQADLCAGSAFLDAFAQERALNGQGFSVSIDWGLFQWDAWQLPAPGGVAVQSQLNEALRAYGLRAQECRDAFALALASNAPQVIVSRRRLGAVIEQTDRLTAGDLLATLRESNGAGGHRRPDLATDYVAPRNEVERAVAGVWQDAFGIERLGVSDNFFELAGNSLLAIQIVTRLRQKFQVKLPTTALFEAPTVAELASWIEASSRPASENEELERMLREVEALSPEEAARRLTDELGAGG